MLSHLKIGAVCEAHKRQAMSQQENASGALLVEDIARHARVEDIASGEMPNCKSVSEI